ncbi:hypothetical protein GCM10018952_62810 [Streptosporangium vulgare]
MPPPTRTTPSRPVAADLLFHRALLAATHNELLERMEIVIETARRTGPPRARGRAPRRPGASAPGGVEAIHDPILTPPERAMRGLLAKAVHDVALRVRRHRGAVRGREPKNGEPPVTPRGTRRIPRTSSPRLRARIRRRGLDVTEALEKREGRA